MIVYGSDGKGVGKLGSSVYSINHGVQIKRQYNPKVFNPSSGAQVDTRSRFALASQISASLEPVIAIPREGLMSPRNQFVKRNFGYFYSTENGAQVSFQFLQLTKGSVAIPYIRADRSRQSSLSLRMNADVTATLNRVVYSVFTVNEDGSLQFAKSAIGEVSSINQFGQVDLPYIGGQIVIYAYGIKDRDAGATAAYEQYQILSGLEVASLVVNRKLKNSMYRLTATRGTVLKEGQNVNMVPSNDYYLISVTAGYGGSVQLTPAEGVTINVIGPDTQVGQIENDKEVVLKAVPDAEYHFVGWRYQGEQTYFSRDTTIRLVKNSQNNVIAHFEYGSGLE